jgi:hypothetical protein
VNAENVARATAALDVWFDDGSGIHPPGYDQYELERMHAALEAPTTDTALEAWPGPPGSPLSTPEQDAQNRAVMLNLRAILSREPNPEADPAEAQADYEAEL